MPRFNSTPYTPEVLASFEEAQEEQERREAQEGKRSYARSILGSTGDRNEKKHCVNQVFLPQQTFYDLADIATETDGMTMAELYAYVADWFIRNWKKPKPGDGIEYVAWHEANSRVVYQARLNLVAMAERARQFQDDQRLADHLSESAKEMDEDPQELLKGDGVSLVSNSRGYRLSRMAACKIELSNLMSSNEIVYADEGLDYMTEHKGFNANLVGKARSELGIESVFEKGGRRIWRYYISE